MARSSIPLAIAQRLDIHCAQAPAEWTGYAFTFKSTLHYDFIVDNPQAAQQICKYSDPMISHALGDFQGPIATKIVPVEDTLEEMGYVASRVVVAVPAGGLVDGLNEMLGNRTSVLYRHPEEIVRQLAGQLDGGLEVVGEFDMIKNY